MASKNQSSRLTKQQKENGGEIGIFGEEAIKHDHLVGNVSRKVITELEEKFPALKFRYRTSINKSEINLALQKLDKELGQTLYVADSNIKPDGGLIEVLDDKNNWRVILVSEAKHQGKDIENIKNGILVGKNNNQDLMFYVIGGSLIYNLLIEEARILYLTEIEDRFKEATVYFPLFNKDNYDIIIGDLKKENGVYYRHNKYVRKKAKYE